MPVRGARRALRQAALGAGSGRNAAPKRAGQSPRVSSEALPPAAVVLTVTTFSVAKRSR